MSEPVDGYKRPYEGIDNACSAMQGYIDGELRRPAGRPRPPPRGGSSRRRASRFAIFSGLKLTEALALEKRTAPYINVVAVRRGRAGTPWAKPIRVNGSAIHSPVHLSPGLGTHPRERSLDVSTLGYRTDLARLLERGLFETLFIADGIGIQDVHGGNAAAALRRPAAAQVVEGGELARDVRRLVGRG